MTIKDIESRLMQMSEPDYAVFLERLLPNVAPERVLGVRIPAIRALAKEVIKDPSYVMFLASLPHRYHEEDLLHALILNEEKDMPLLEEKLNSFLPYVNNWAVCDTIKPKAFRKNRGRLMELIREMLVSEHEYTVRFGLGMLMAHYLDEDFSEEALSLAASVSREEYYIRMMQAWFFATALAKQYEHAIPYLEEHRLSKEVTNMTVRKCLDSFRISEERKNYIKLLK